jgi:hypothetical protein
MLTEKQAQFEEVYSKRKMFHKRVLIIMAILMLLSRIGGSI